MVAMTATTLPMNMPWTQARSLLSAKPKMYASTIAEMKNRAIHSGVGITPGAPWMRCLAGLLAVRGLVQPLAVGGLLHGRVELDASQRCSNMAAPHGLMSSPSEPLSIRSHSPWMTERA